MLKKIIACYLLILATVLTFSVDLTALTDRAVLLLSFRQEESPAPSPDAVVPSAFYLGEKCLQIGDSEQRVVDVFGEAKERFLSEYGFYWYAFFEDYADYVQIGLGDDHTVCGIYSNAATFRFNGISVGSSMDEVRFQMGEPLTEVPRQGFSFRLNCDVDGNREMDVFLFCDCYIRVFYDCFKNNTVTAIHIIKRDTETAPTALYAEATEEWARSAERENFLVTNALRVREGLPPLAFSSGAQGVALSHSQDMAEHQYFDHTDRFGRTVLERMKEGGVFVSVVGENLASGGQSGLIMHELLMNSEGHRANILGEYRFLGVGVAFDSERKPYLTQVYYVPPAIRFG